MQGKSTEQEGVAIHLPFSLTAGFAGACLLLATPLLAARTDEPGTESGGGWIAAQPSADRRDSLHWVDRGQAYASKQAQALTHWMDDYFGDPEYILEEPESQLRLELIDDWDSEDGNDVRIRLRGKLELPAVSHRLGLVFRGEDSDLEIPGEEEDDNEVGLQYWINKGHRSRADLTLGFSSGHLRPGIKFRNQGSMGDRYSYRLVERIQYEHGENLISKTRVDLNRAIGNGSVLRWSSGIDYGERTEGVEWRTGLSLRQRLSPGPTRPVVLRYFTSVNGVTRPQSLQKNYRIGMSWRRQVFRDYLFFELEPAYSYRRRHIEDERKGAWQLMLRVEIALQRDSQVAAAEP